MLDVGDTHRLRFTARDADGELVSPEVVEASVTLPDGTTETLPTPTEDEAGRYHVDYAITHHGRHVVRWRATDPDSAYFDVFNAVAEDWPAIVGLAEVKRHLNMAAGDDSEDEELRGFILSASAVVEDIVGTCARRTVVETASGGERHLRLERPPVLEVTQVAVDGETVDPGAYTVSPSGLVAHRHSRWPAGLRNVEVTYVAGREVVPANVLDATRELIRVNWRPQQGGNYGPYDGGGGDDFGNAGLEASLQGNLRLGFFIPNTVIQRLQPNQRGPVVM